MPFGTANTLLSRLWTMVGVALVATVLLVLGIRNSMGLDWKPASSGFSLAPDDRELILLFPVNKEAPRKALCRCLVGALVHGYSPIIINWDHTGGRGSQQIAKVFGTHDFLLNKYNVTQVRDHDVVFMADALDLWLQLPPSSLMKRFDEHEHSVIVGADKKCWPNTGPECAQVPESTVPKGSFGVTEEAEAGDRPHTRPRWANSGTIIGTVEKMRDLYADLRRTFEQRTGLTTDRGVFNEYLRDRRISVDYWGRMFWADSNDLSSAIFMNTADRVNLDLKAGSADYDIIPTDLLPPMMWHLKTGQIPVALHFNDAGSKGWMDHLWDRGMLWWTKADQRFRRIVLDRLEGKSIRFAHDGSQQDYFELCPTAILDLEMREDWTGL